MTSEEFLNEAKSKIEEGVNIFKSGITHIKFRSGEDVFIDSSLFGDIQGPELAMFMLALSHRCEEIHVISPLYTPSYLKQGTKENNKIIKSFPIFSLTHIGFKNFTDERIDSTNYPKKIDIKDIDFSEECYVFDVSNNNITYAPLITDLSQAASIIELDKRIDAVMLWKKVSNRLSNNNYYVELPCGELSNHIELSDIKDTIINGYNKQFTTLYKDIDTMFDKIKKEYDEFMSDDEDDEDTRSDKDNDDKDNLNKPNNKSKEKESDNDQKHNSSPKNSFLDNLRNRFK